MPPRGQDLTKIGRLLDAEEIVDELKIPNPHYTISRYPNATNTVPSEAYTKEIAERCLQAADKILEWVVKNGELP